MKKYLVILLLSITASLFTLTACGNITEAEESSAFTTEATTTVSTEATESVVYTPDPTATPEPMSTPTPKPAPTVTPPPEASDNSDKSVDEIAAEENYILSEQEKADLRTLGATEEQINNVKSGQDFIDLVYSLVNSGSSTGNSSSGSGNDSNSSNEEVHDPSRDNQLDDGDGSLPGSMGSAESESDPWGDIPATPMEQGTVGGYM